MNDSPENVSPHTIVVPEGKPAMPEPAPIDSPLGSTTALKFYCYNLVLGNYQVEGKECDLAAVRKEAASLYRWMTKE